MKTKRLLSFGLALLLSLSSMLALNVPQASAATITWDGEGGNNNFSTDTNWVGDVAPVDGDSLVFPALGTEQAPINDTAFTYAGVSFTGASGSCATSPYVWYDITGTQALSLSGNISNTMTGSCPSVYMDLDVNVTANLSVTGSAPISFTSGNTVALGANTLTFNATGYNAVYSNITGLAASSIVSSGSGINLSGTNTSFDGTIVLNSGYNDISPSAFGASSAGTSVNAGADLRVNNMYKNTTLSEPFTLSGASPNPTNTPKLDFSVYGDSPADYAPGVTSILSATYDGALTLESDAVLGVDSIRNKLTISGALAGSFKLTRLDGEGGVIMLAASPNGSQTANGNIASARKDTVISVDQAYGVYLNANKQTTINAGVTVTGDSEVSETGILVVQGKIIGTVLAKDDSVVKGNGIIEGPLTLSERAKLAPGLSPGCLATGNLTFATGTIYEFEVGGVTECTQYDQTKVTGTVTLGNGTLSTILYNGFKPVKDQTYKIIDNDAADAIVGTFLNLAEGATFTVDGYVLKISYVGGDGNDVVLTVQSVPAVPDTGFKLLTSNPIITLFTTTVLAAGIALLARRYSKIATNK